MGPGRGKGPVCPHLPGAEMLIWAHLCPFGLPPTGDPPAVWEMEVLMVGSRQQWLAALYGGGGWAGGGHVALRPVMARKAGRQGTLCPVSRMGEPEASLLLGALFSPGSSIPP